MDLLHSLKGPPERAAIQRKIANVVLVLDLHYFAYRRGQAHGPTAIGRLTRPDVFRRFTDPGVTSPPGFDVPTRSGRSHRWARLRTRPYSHRARMRASGQEVFRDFGVPFLDGVVEPLCQAHPRVLIAKLKIRPSFDEEPHDRDLADPRRASVATSPSPPANPAAPPPQRGSSPPQPAPQRSRQGAHAYAESSAATPASNSTRTISTRPK